LDGTFTVTLNAGAATHGDAVAADEQRRRGMEHARRRWVWTPGGPMGGCRSLTNGNNDAVNLVVADGEEFQVFAVDTQNRMF
jgi:hypothetical protein